MKKYLMLLAIGVATTYGCTETEVEEPGLEAGEEVGIDQEIGIDEGVGIDEEMGTETDMGADYGDTTDETLIDDPAATDQDNFMEDTGAAMDEGMQNLEAGMEETGEEMQEGMNEMEQGIEGAGAEMGQEMEEAGEELQTQPVE